MKSCTPVEDEATMFELLPLEALNPIVFRCGTEEERDIWVEKLSAECNKLTGEEKEEVLHSGGFCDHLKHVAHEVSEVPHTCKGKIGWLLSLPHTIAFGITIPDVKQPQFEKYYAISAIMFLVWLPILSLLMVKSVNGIAEAWGIDKAIMALTISAAGTSFPDFFASMVVAREGQGDMACSNAFGSNIFNIFLASGAPWAVFATFVLSDKDTEPGGVGGYTKDGELALHIPSPDIVSGIITLAVSLVLFVAVMICTKFKLTAAIGWMFACVYFVYIGVMVYNQTQKGS
jgi:Ca2+/Na+ antiporter